MRRRTVIAAAGAAAAAPVIASMRAGADPVMQAGWQLRWAPEASQHGLGAFEGIEDDRADSHPAGQPHIFVEGNNYRFNMHMVDRDTMTDRQRQEVRGMRWNGANLNLLQGERWRLTHQMYIPSSLKATTSFTHIMQTKAPGTGTLPMLVMSLRRHGSVPKIEFKAFEGNVLLGAVDLNPLHNKWIDVEVEMVIGNNGQTRWVLRDGSTTLIDVTRNVDNWLHDRVRPKWGIYRSLGDTSGSLQNCYMLIRNMRAYKWDENADPPPPTGDRYEAENAQISRGVVESNHAGFSGTGFVNTENAAGPYVQWSVNAAAAGTAKLTFGFANGTTTDRPMALAVNGAPAGTVNFPGTGAWTNWQTASTTTVGVNAGSNTIRLTATTGNGGPNLDYVDVDGPSTTPREYQAEDAVISQGAVESNHAGFTGTGFVNTDNAVGPYVEFTVAGPATSCAIRYANGTTTNRPMSLNGSNVDFPGTGAWTNWSTVTVPVSLGAGTHRLRFTATTSNGGPNLDKITLH